VRGQKLELTSPIYCALINWLTLKELILRFTNCGGKTDFSKEGESIR
jgi:hypothetical protein